MSRPTKHISSRQRSLVGILSTSVSPKKEVRGLLVRFRNPLSPKFNFRIMNYEFYKDFVRSFLFVYNNISFVKYKPGYHCWKGLPKEVEGPDRVPEECYPCNSWHRGVAGAPQFGRGTSTGPSAAWCIAVARGDPGCNSGDPYQPKS